MAQLKIPFLPGKRTQVDVTVSVSLALIAVFFVLSGVISYLNIRTLREDNAAVIRTHEVLIGADELFSTLKDAETGQRGYVLTGRDSYLAPYNDAVATLPGQMINLDRLTAGSPSQNSRIAGLKIRVQSKMAELAETIEIRRSQGFDKALAIVQTDRGKGDMDAIRQSVAAMQAEENQTRQQKLAEMERAYVVAIASITIAAAIGVVLSVIITWLISRASAQRREQDWLQAGQAGLSAAMMGDQRLEQVGRNALTYLAEYCNAHAGAFFAADGGTYRRAATYGVPDESNVPDAFVRSQSLLGQAVADNRILVVDDLPDNHLTIGSSLGTWRPRQILIAPARGDGGVEAVIELGFLQPMPPRTLDLLERASELVAVAVRAANYRAHLQNLLEETQRQSEELQSQSEELRVTNEELEEQSRSLKESQARLEQQQTELEQTNAQLEEQASVLERQKDDLSRTTVEVEQKARQLEQASTYKSHFLANMSHELRTPLNSSLILAKLLADNADGNLTDEQVQFAHTIQSSGNDLLALINDILDLSKIEAGQMEIRPETVTIKRLVTDMTRIFEPVAHNRGLKFTTTVAKGVPEAVDTDRQRLEQVLKNLLSNAFKFTEKGGVELVIAPGPGKTVAFSVKDTGIGIDAAQQQAVFDAFRQADGTISRKYGGTGLGLSISRELARLLGGQIDLESQPGKGSTFTIAIPAAYDPSAVASQPTLISAPSTMPEPEPSPFADERRPRPSLGDDRDRLTPNSRSILVVEDDDAFARILYDLAHEQDFLCLLANTAEDALTMARQYLPSAIILDVGLPDHSGLSVLDRIKRDVRTRHIPVHVVSASDYTHTALSMGAIGYMLKPVKREELVDAFQQLETRLARRVRRVLIVEDDAVQRDSMGKLLKSQDIETVAVGTAAECLDLLKESTFDCMVLDLSLPDASGYSLLETLSQEEAYAFPPVIVYTGHDLTYDDEQRLRRYSKSIIIKGAKSPERLLDEVTLFLHQVVSELSPEQQRLLKKAKSRDAMLEGRRILVVEDDVRNVYAVTNIFEPLGAVITIARNGREALEALEKVQGSPGTAIDLVLMDAMMPEMDGLTATREIRKRPEWKKLPVIMLTAKAMKDDQEKCLDAGANDYMAKPIDVEKLVSLVRVWMPG